MRYVCEYKSPLGRLTLSSLNGELTDVSFSPIQDFILHLHEEYEIVEDDVLKETREWLDSYFRGERDIQLPKICFYGTEFQLLVWNILLEIPYGEITSYGEIAKRVAEIKGISRMSAQAIGGAVGKNPIAILVPCHRVLGKNREITGYAGGLDKKEYLLKLEGISYLK